MVALPYPRHCTWLGWGLSSHPLLVGFLPTDFPEWVPDLGWGWGWARHRVRAPEGSLPV